MHTFLHVLTILVVIAIAVPTAALMAGLAAEFIRDTRPEIGDEL